MVKCFRVYTGVISRNQNFYDCKDSFKGTRLIAASVHSARVKQSYLLNFALEINGETLWMFKSAQPVWHVPGNNYHSD